MLPSNRIDYDDSVGRVHVGHRPLAVDHLDGDVGLGNGTLDVVHRNCARPIRVATQHYPAGRVENRAVVQPHRLRRQGE